MRIGRRYEILELLGEGGMGRVFAARDRLSGQEVALKQVALQKLAAQAATLAAKGLSKGPPSNSDVSPVLRTFRLALANEFHTLSRVRHPNIVSVLDYGFDENREPYFTMELLSSPRDLLQATVHAALADKLDVLAQLLRALSYLHRRGIIHREISEINSGGVSGS